MKQAERSRILTWVLLIFALCLLIIGSLGAANALPQITSEYYSGGIEMYDIGVELIENDVVVSSRTYSENARYVWDEEDGALLGSLLAEGEKFHLGQVYREELCVNNSGKIDEYVRVTIYRYWQDAKGKKITTLSPDLIDLHLVTGGDWIKDEKASSTERTVLYHASVVPAGKKTSLFADSLCVSGDIPYKVTQTEENGVITTTYDYEGVTFQVEITVDAVQTHSAEEAIRSAWGRKVTITNDRLSLS